MSVVVERGVARCPRCVAVAEYTFVESGLNSLRYEVHCGKCGEAYCEVHSPVAPGFTAAVEALTVRVPDDAAPAAGLIGQRARARLGDARERASRVAVGGSAWIALKGRAFRR